MIYQFTPILKYTPWGGYGLCRMKGMARPPQPVGESWELSDLPGMQTVVASGPETGSTLSQLIERHGASLLGRRVFDEFGGKFPLLLKFLDSRQWLSLQVHPDNATAPELEGPGAVGKSEMWYVVEAEPDASLILGFKPGVTPEAYRRAEGSAGLMELVNFLKVERDMKFNISSGTVHALGPGCLVAEVQQPCDLTYRVYDHGRPRELHLEKARRALRFEGAGDEWIYKVDSHHLPSGAAAALEPVEGSFVALMVTRGECEIEGETYGAGSTLLVSADHGAATLRTQGREADYLTIAL